MKENQLQHITVAGFLIWMYLLWNKKSVISEAFCRSVP